MTSSNQLFSFRLIPFIYIGLLFTIGILTAHFGAFDRSLWLFFVFLSAVCWLFVLFYNTKKLVNLSALYAFLCMQLFAFSIGGLLDTQHHTFPPNHVNHLLSTATDAKIQGIVDSFPVKTPRGLRFTLESESILIDTDTLSLAGKINVFILDRDSLNIPPTTIFPKLNISLEGKLQKPLGKRNPADFDFASFLAHKGIYATLFVDSPLNVQIPHQSQKPSFIGRLRTYTATTIDSLASTPESRAVLKALLIGDKNELDDDIKTQFSDTGLMHLLAVSGLHVLIVGLILYNLLKVLFNRIRYRFPALSWAHVEWARALITVLVLIIYMFVTNVSPSVVRAVIMTTLWIGATLSQRKTAPLNALGIAFVLGIFINPHYLFEVGFQLSFVAVASLLLVLPTLQSFFSEKITSKRLLWPLIQMMLVSLTATLGTMPVLLYHFGAVSFAGILLNLIAIPLTFVVLASGLLGVLTFNWFPFIAKAFGATASLCVELLIQTASFGQTYLSGLHISWYLTNGWFLIALILLLFTFALWHEKKIRWKTLSFASICMTVGLWIAIWQGAFQPRLKLLFFDIGQGDATLIEFPNGKKMLIDAGVRNQYTDKGLTTIYPHLQRFNIPTLDAVLITHPDADHLGGLPSLLKSNSVCTVYMNGQPYESALFQETKYLIETTQTPLHYVKAGDSISLDASVKVLVLHPAQVPFENEKANWGSIVLLIQYGTQSFLFMGDAEADAEALLLEHYQEILPSNLIKVGHHGSRTSSTEPFVDVVAKKDAIAVVSVAKENRYGLPDEDALGNWIKHHATLQLTSSEGALWFQSDGSSITQIDW